MRGRIRRCRECAEHPYGNVAGSYQLGLPIRRETKYSSFLTTLMHYYAPPEPAEVHYMMFLKFEWLTIYPKMPNLQILKAYLLIIY